MKRENRDDRSVVGKDRGNGRGSEKDQESHSKTWNHKIRARSGSETGGNVACQERGTRERRVSSPSTNLGRAGKKGLGDGSATRLTKKYKNRGVEKRR